MDDRGVVRFGKAWPIEDQHHHSVSRYINELIVLGLSGPTFRKRSLENLFKQYEPFAIGLLGLALWTSGRGLADSAC